MAAGPRGSVDWAAQRIRTMLDEDELTEAEFRRLQRSGWTPPASSPADTAVKTGDPVADFVRPDLLRREAMREEARRRARQQFAQAVPVQSSTPSVPPRNPAVPAQRQTMIDPNDERAYRFVDEIIDNWEGGFAPDSAGPTKYGIRQTTLETWNDRHENPADKMPDDVRDLTKDQARRIMKEYFYDAHGLGEIANDRLAHQLLGIYVNTGTKGLRQIIQGAVDQIMRDHNLYNRHERPFALSDPAGPMTRSRLNWLMSSGYGAEIQNALANRRYNYVKGEGRLTGNLPSRTRRVQRHA